MNSSWVTTLIMIPASREVQLFISFVNFRATSLVSISYIFPPTVVLKSLFLILNIIMLRAHYISMLIYRMVVLARKENGYCGDFCCVASQCNVKCTVLRHRWEPESSKESSISFLLVEKEEKKLLAEH